MSACVVFRGESKSLAMVFLLVIPKCRHITNAHLYTQKHIRGAKENAKYVCLGLHFL